MSEKDDRKDKELEKQDDASGQGAGSGTPASVDAILQERMKLEQQQAELDKKLKDQFQKNITVMFTDIKGSTSFFETFGDVEGRAMVQRHNSILFPEIEKHGGKVIKTIGDAIMATFEDPASGVKAAIEMQKALEEHNKQQDQKHKRIEVRIGLNFGPAVVEENDVFGDAVNVAARVESQADAGQILLSDELYKKVKNEEEILVRFFGEVEIKGKSEPVKLYRVVWSEEQMVAESEYKKAASRRTVDKRGYTAKGRVLELIVSRDANQVKVSVLERQRGEERTVSQYDVVKLDDKTIKQQLEEVVNLLNRSNKRGRITKEILKQLQAAGQVLFDHLLTPEAKQKIQNTQAEHLLIRMDDALVQIPWELLFDGKHFLCQRFSMGRIVATRQRVSDTLERNIAKPLRMLLIADPRSDLPASRMEGATLRDELDKEDEFINVNLKAAEVPVNFVRTKIRDYDLIHYAGHADYDKDDPGNSGWLLADGKISADEIKSMTGKKPMPALVFANSCQSGMTEEWKIESGYGEKIFGLANSFLVSGVQHYIGTFWDILDEPGQDFALSFYHEMIAGASVGEAVRRARLALVDKYGEESVVWASYMLYGDPTFSYLEDVEAAEEAEQAEAPAAAPAQAAGLQQAAAVTRGADSMAAPRPLGMSRSAMALMAAAAVAVVLAVVGYFKFMGGEVVIPEDGIAAAYMKLDKGDLAAAMSQFDKLAENKTTRAQGLSGLAAVYLAKNDLVLAEQKAKDALAIDPQATYAHIVLGQIAYNRGNYGQAIDEFNRASKGAGKEAHKQQALAKLAMAYNAAGLEASRSGDSRQALDSYQAAYQADPGNAEAAVNLGQKYLAMGKPAEAKNVFEAAVKANPDDTVANTLLAQAVNLMKLQQDSHKQAQINELAKDLAERWRSGKIPAPPRDDDAWTSSRPVTMTFLDFDSKGRITMEGEREFMMIALTQALRDTGRVEVVEREKIDRILSELNLASSELANQQTRLRLGRLFGARLIATGSYIRHGEETQVNLRLIETETSIAKVAVAEVLEGDKPPGQIAQAISDILMKKIKKTYPIRGLVTEKKDGSVRINVGRSVGVTDGMRMAILDDDLIKIGEIEITAAGPEAAAARVLEGSPARGMKVREIVD